MHYTPDDFGICHTEFHVLDDLESSVDKGGFGEGFYEGIAKDGGSFLVVGGMLKQKSPPLDSAN